MSVLICFALLGLAGYLGYKYVVSHKSQLEQDAANKLSADAKAAAAPAPVVAAKPAAPSSPSQSS